MQSCCVLSIDIDDALYNAALNRPVFASSELLNWVGKYNFYAYLANDGDLRRNARLDGGRCFISKNEVHPWWAVDLGRPMAVDRADFTNRGDCCGMMNCMPVSQLSLLSKYRESHHQYCSVSNNVILAFVFANDLQKRLG